MCWMKISEANEPLHWQHLIIPIPQIDALAALDGRMEKRWPILVLNEWAMHQEPRSAFGADRGSKAISTSRNDRSLCGTAWMIGPCSGGEWNGRMGDG